MGSSFLRIGPDLLRYLEKLHSPTTKLVNSADHLHLSGLDHAGQDRIQVLEPLNALRDVGPGGVLELVAGNEPQLLRRPEFDRVQDGT